MTDEIQINKISSFELSKLSKGGKKRNKNLLERLAVHNRQMTSPAEILSQLEISGDDLQFLNSLGHRPDGWHPFVFSTGKVPGDQKRLAALGLILFGKKRKISLADAGRFLLVLTFL
ncbi:hypothetical protein C4J81_09775 [Deltaproteobacteria bacterium Smac51]|nr:hypothetical protein C4J81_09775 [Deltaproteobacteria bacterium Smac51]